jgi:hypothetical protein
MQVGKMAGNYWIKLEWKRWQQMSLGVGQLVQVKDVMGMVYPYCQ